LSATAVQVLVSIQSLILVPEPYFNEVSVVQAGQTGDTTICTLECRTVPHTEEQHSTGVGSKCRGPAESEFPGLIVLPSVSTVIRACRRLQIKPCR
jgi:hypothetical protein